MMTCPNKEWIALLKEFDKEIEESARLSNKWHDNLRSFEEEFKRIWWANKYLSLPSEFLSIKDFDSNDVHSIFVEEITCHVDTDFFETQD